MHHIDRYKIIIALVLFQQYFQKADTFKIRIETITKSYILCFMLTNNYVSIINGNQSKMCAQRKKIQKTRVLFLFF